MEACCPFAYSHFDRLFLGRRALVRRSFYLSVCLSACSPPLSPSSFTSFSTPHSHQPCSSSSSPSSSPCRLSLSASFLLSVIHPHLCLPAAAAARGRSPCPLRLSQTQAVLSVSPALNALPTQAAGLSCLGAAYLGDTDTVLYRSTRRLSTCCQTRPAGTKSSNFGECE